MFSVSTSPRLAARTTSSRISPPSFQVYKNFVPPPSSLEFVESHFKKTKSLGKNAKPHEFLSKQPTTSSYTNKNNYDQKPSIYSINCGGVHLSHENCAKVIDDVTDVADEDIKKNNSHRLHKQPMLPRNDVSMSPISRTAEGYSVWENHFNLTNCFTKQKSPNMSLMKSSGKKKRTLLEIDDGESKREISSSSSSSSSSSATRTIPPFEVFEGNAKDQWIDGTRGFCHICQEPIGSVLNHVGDRDHACMVAYLYFFSLYPRTWSVRKIVLDALHRFPRVGYNAVGHPFANDHLHTLDDSQRRLELESMLVHLSNPESPNFALPNVLQGNASISLWVAGERIFKPNLSQLVSEMCLPMTAGIQTGVTQKCWSRTNLERMYDALNVAKIQESFGAEAKTERLPKAFFMRSLFFELHAAVDETMNDEPHYSDPYWRQVVRANEDDYSQQQNKHENDDVHDLHVLPQNHDYDYHDATKKLLIQECLRRMAFELVFLNTMHYMNRVQYVARQLKLPTWHDLHGWDSL